MDDTQQFQRTARTRQSFRGFLDKSVPDHIIQEVLKDAQCAPSNCNTQPWAVHIVRGQKLVELSRILHAKNTAGEFTPDFSFDMDAFYGRYGDRKNAQGKAYYEVLGISEEMKMLFGMSFGYPDESAPGNRTHMDRVPIADSVTFHS